MNDYSLRGYIKFFWRHLLLVFFGAVFIASVLWFFFPTHSTCCDAYDYWKSSESLDGIKSSHYNFGTFFYPTLIAFVRYLPNYFKISADIQYYFLSVVQLLLHLVAVVALSYTTYIITNNKYITLCTTYIYGLNIFIIAYTNQILTDGVALSFLVMTIAFFVRITVSPKSNIVLVMTFVLLAGLLPMIRPALFLVSISLYIMFLIGHIYKMCKHKINILSLSTIFLSVLAFLIPLTVQAVINPQLFDNIRALGKGQYEFGAYMYKFISIVEPPPAYGYVAYNYPIKQLIDICKASTQSSDCIKQVFTAHPLMALGHYATKIFTLNDQVYLTAYIHNFFTPDRHIWRLINCMFLASSTIGLALAIKKARRNIRKYFFVSLVTLIILTSLMLPLIASMPEERYGIHFHPFFALSTSYLLYSCFGSNQFTLAELSKIPTKILLILFALAFLLFQFSLYIESTFGIRM